MKENQQSIYDFEDVSTETQQQQQPEQAAKEKQCPSRAVKFAMLIVCALTVFLAVLSLFTPVIRGHSFSVRPIDFLLSWQVDDIAIDIVPNMVLSYYVCKIFYFAFALIVAVGVFMCLVLFVVKSKYVQILSNCIMYAMLLILLLSTLLGFNYINIIKALDAVHITASDTFVYLILGLILLVVKVFIDMRFGQKRSNVAVEAGVRVYSTLATCFIALICMAFPLYIFPGTKYRMNGFDILLGSEDVLDFMPMTVFYKIALMVFTFGSALCFIVNVLLYIKSKRAFLSFARFSNLFSVVSVILYGVMGLNYMVCYLDAQGYNQIFNTSMNTYSYIPLLLLGVFWCGCGFVKLGTSKVKAEYKVYATMGELALTGGKDKEEEKEEEKEEVVESFDPIPAFSEIDKRADEYGISYSQRLESARQGLTLAELVDHVIEYARYSRERLSYGQVEVKTFIAGLAASRLSILQGMSGTGKTSLPKIFMEAIDGFCDIVAIESSWRDKNELLGYYNEFNKKYTPKTFTQYLYKACLNKDIPTFIVLDEMNLSRIEYYFSDFLSLMEARENQRSIKLFDVQLYPDASGEVGYKALKDGHTIEIPTNVWFIGTANRDESTFEISDKVYDRAQTMNFDKRAPKVVLTEEKTCPKIFVPYVQLRQLFEGSKSIGFDSEKNEAIKKVEKLLLPYKISFGNRVLKQIEEFVNAYVACSRITSPQDTAKYVHEAVDCIMMSKVVRKLELKQISDLESLIEDFEALSLPKCTEFLRSLTEQ